ncbi:MAG TPA: GNAT family N-acetyltransferase [Streptosporangiaceae bacterium]|nr:GNAT family N-acetyltransferase [Streptosporangiaceae bacterium]
MDPVLIRPATPDDLDDLLTLYREMAEGRPAAQPADARSARPIFQAILADPVRHLQVAAIGTHLVGSADMIIVANLPHDARPWAVIENVIVAASARRQGVATALMHRLMAIASSAGCYKVQLMSGKQRTPAHALYRKLGFTAAAEGFKIFLDGGAPAI